MSGRALGFLGAGLLCAGVFAPLISHPLFGTTNLYGNGSSVFPYLVLGLAAVATFFGLMNKGVAIIWPGWVAIFVIGTLFFRANSSLVHFKSEATRSLSDNRFRGIGQALVNSTSFGWGWLMLGLGAGLLIYSAKATSKETGISLAVLTGATETFLVFVTLGILLVYALSWLAGTASVEIWIAMLRGGR